MSRDDNETIHEFKAFMGNDVPKEGSVMDVLSAAVLLSLKLGPKNAADLLRHVLSINDVCERAEGVNLHVNIFGHGDPDGDDRKVIGYLFVGTRSMFDMVKIPKVIAAMEETQRECEQVVKAGENVRKREPGAN